MASGNASTLKVVVYAIVGNSVITIAKFLGWLLTSSPSILAETVHSLADTLNQVLLLIGVKHSEKEASSKYPFGQGAARYLWNLISAVGIFFLGFGVTAYHGVHSLIQNHTFVEPHYIAVLILFFALIIEGYVFILAWKNIRDKKGEDSWIDYLKRSDDPTTIAVLFEDGIAVIGVTLALGGVFLSKIFQSNIPDSITSILISISLGFMAIGLAYVNGRLLLGKSVPPDEEEKIRKFVRQQNEVEKIANLKTRILGPDRVKLSIEIEFHGGAFIDRQQISIDGEKIRDGEDPIMILYETSERMVRIMGHKINDLEKRIYKEFPYVVSIDLEVN
jgi:zinc transporter 9